MGYGAWEAGGTAWGPNESDNSVIGAMRAALDAGITWIDTAEVYGDGVSESLVGRAIAGRRDEVIVASKVAPQPEGSGVRPDRIAALATGAANLFFIWAPWVMARGWVVLGHSAVGEPDGSMVSTD